MTKNELIAQVAANAGISKKDAGMAVNATLSIISQALREGDKVSIAGFGSFGVSQREERTARNPRDGSPITIPAKKVPVFRPAKSLRESVL